MQPAAEVARLVRRPAFLLSSIRSGSTLLRCLLNSHSMICAPHELHLRYVGVTVDSDYAALGTSLLGFDVAELQRLLWDRTLHALLVRSGTAVIVDKSPSNVWVHESLRQCWPHATFIILRRNPSHIARSIANAGDGRGLDEAVALVNRFGEALDAVLTLEPETVVIRYEDLIADPGKVCHTICQVLDVPYEPVMLDYGRHDNGPFIYGVGDWGKLIRSGRIQRRPANDCPTPSRLVDLCERWGYPVRPEAAP